MSCRFKMILDGCKAIPRSCHECQLGPCKHGFKDPYKKELIHHAVIDSGLGGIPEEVRKALGFAADQAGQHMKLNNGVAALFFALVGELNRHVSKEPTHD